MIYIASPIAHSNPYIVESRVSAAKSVAIYLYDRGVPIFCPASHSSGFASLSSNTGGWRYWQQIHLPILQCCCTHLLVLMLPGWGTSIEVGAEINRAEEIGLIITYVGMQHQIVDASVTGRLNELILHYNR